MIQSLCPFCRKFSPNWQIRYSDDTLRRHIIQKHKQTLKTMRRLFK